jgi:hypothetical protein
VIHHRVRQFGVRTSSFECLLRPNAGHFTRRRCAKVPTWHREPKNAGINRQGPAAPSVPSGWRRLTRPFKNAWRVPPGPDRAAITLLTNRMPGCVAVNRFAAFNRVRTQPPEVSPRATEHGLQHRLRTSR